LLRPFCGSALVQIVSNDAGENKNRTSDKMKTYEFNIALNGQHFLFVGSRNNITQEQAENLLIMLKLKFSHTDGYSVNCTVCTEIRTNL